MNVLVDARARMAIFMEGLGIFLQGFQVWYQTSALVLACVWGIHPEGVLNKKTPVLLSTHLGSCVSLQFLSLK